MAAVAQLLDSLHPLREPPPPAPVVPFLIMLCGGIIVAVIGFAAVWQVRRRRKGLRRAAQIALAATRELDPGERLAAQARLLRRLVRALAGDQAARAKGEEWLAALDRAFASRDFTQGEGRAYGDALYRRDGAGNVEALDRTLESLIARLGGGSRTPDPAA